MHLSQELKVFWLLTLLRIFHTVDYRNSRCNTTKTYLRGELFDKGGGVILHYVPYGIKVLISGLLLAQEVFSVDITNLLEPFYHPADAEGLGDYAVHLPELSSYVTTTLEPSKLQNYPGFLLRGNESDLKNLNRIYQNVHVYNGVGSKMGPV